MSKAQTADGNKNSIYSEALKLVSSLQTEQTCKDALLNIANYLQVAQTDREHRPQHDSLKRDVSHALQTTHNTERMGKLNES